MSLLKTEPMPAFRFLIILGDSGSALSFALSAIADFIFDGGFSQCNGLNMEQEPYEYKEGGLLDYTHQMPGQAKYGKITLKWGMGFNNSLWEWQFNTARSLAYGQPWKRKDGTIIALPYAGFSDLMNLATGAQVWYFRKGIPSRWSGPEFDAQQNQIAVETLEIAHEGLERWYPPNLSAIVGAAVDKIRAAL